jgi:hypothetical protein
MQTAKLHKFFTWEVNGGREGGHDLQLAPYFIATLNKNSKNSFNELYLAIYNINITTT